MTKNAAMGDAAFCLYFRPNSCFCKRFKKRLALIFQNPLFFTSFFRNFVRIRRISLYKGSLGN